MLEMKNISFEVPEENGGGQKEILRDISLTVDDQSFFVITGPNGGGKSTLAKLIMGIEKPTGGKSCLTEPTLPGWILPSAPTWASALPFSSRCASRG